ALAPAPPALLDVRMGTAEGRPAVQIETAAPLGEVGFSRDKAQIVLSFQATAPTPLPQPQVTDPLQAARLVRAGDHLELRLGVPADVPYFLRREGNVLQLVLDVPRARA